MGSVVDRVVPHLPAPEETVLEEARAASRRGPDAHGRLLRRIPAFAAIEQRPPDRVRACPAILRIAAFNSERLGSRPATRFLLERAGADLALLSEVDCGMARSGNTHNLRDLTATGREGYLFGAEFVELDLGDRGEMRAHAGERNAAGLHGNAIVTGLALEAPHLIPLEAGGLWFSGFEGAQRRIGRRMALAARVGDAPLPLWVVSTHLESKTDPADRQRQIQALLKALDAIAPDAPCVIGGDFNTKALPRSEDERHLLLDAPERYEPLFGDLARAGFAWTEANLARPTQTPGPKNKHAPPFGKLDWIVARGLAVANPRIVPAVDREGRAVSDHEMIAVDVRLP